MNETRKKPTTGRQSPSLFDKWHTIFYMPSRIDMAVHTKAFDYPFAEHWRENRNVQPGEDSNRQYIGSQSNALPTEPSPNPGSSTGGSYPNWGIVGKEQPVIDCFPISAQLDRFCMMQQRGHSSQKIGIFIKLSRHTAQFYFFLRFCCWPTFFMSALGL